MGYSTDFTGELKFDYELSASELYAVKQFLEEDCRDHPEWGTRDLYYVDLELLGDFSGLKWNGAEKTYGMVEVINMIIDNMRKKHPDFGLKGVLHAQGEDFEDRWDLVINSDGRAERVEIPRVGDKVTCPYCESAFTLESNPSPIGE